MEWLKELLKGRVAEDQLEETLQSINKEFPKHAMPKNVYNEKADEVKALKEQLAEQNKLMEPLTKKAETVEEYEKQIKDWQEKYTQLETESTQKIQSIAKTNALKDLFVAEGADTGLVDLLVEKYNGIAEYEDGKIKDPQSLVKQVKEERKSAFIQKQESTEGDVNQNGQASDKDTGSLRKAFGLK